MCGDETRVELSPIRVWARQCRTGKHVRLVVARLRLWPARGDWARGGARFWRGRPTVPFDCCLTARVMSCNIRAATLYTLPVFLHSSQKYTALPNDYLQLFVTYSG